MGESKRRKLSRDATSEEIFPGGHGPVQATVVDAMRITLDALQTVLGKNYTVTLFVAEQEATEGREDPRFNYMSSAARPDMIAVLKAFIKRQEEIGPTLDKLESGPTEGTKQ